MHAHTQRTSTVTMGSSSASGSKRNPSKCKDIFLATKFAAAVNPVNSSPDYAKEVANNALKRLCVDTIDLFYIYRLDGVTPVEQTVRAVVELKNEGKIRYLGISECSAESLRRAKKVHQIAAVQVRSRANYRLESHGRS